MTSEVAVRAERKKGEGKDRESAQSSCTVWKRRGSCEKEDPPVAAPGPPDRDERQTFWLYLHRRLTVRLAQEIGSIQEEDSLNPCMQLRNLYNPTQEVIGDR